MVFNDQWAACGFSSPSTLTEMGSAKVEGEVGGPRLGRHFQGEETCSDSIFLRGSSGGGAQRCHNGLSSRKELTGNAVVFDDHCEY